MKTGALLLFLAAGVCQDVKKGKIRNKLNVSGTAAGILLAFLHGPREGILACEGWLLAALAGFLFYAAGMIKAGDAKFMWIIGAFKGPSRFLNALALGILAGGLMSLAILWKKRDGRKRFYRFFTYVRLMLFARQYEPYQAEEKEAFPFSLPLAAGAALDLFYTII